MGQYSANALRRLNDFVATYTAPALAFIHSNPFNRNPNDLPLLYEDISNLLADYRALQVLVPTDAFTRTCRDLSNILEMLEELSLHMEALVDGSPPVPGKVWEIMPGGGRKLVLDIELLETLSNEGMTDEEIASFMNCCRLTIHRRRREFGIQKREWAQLSDDDLREVCALLDVLSNTHLGAEAA